VSRYRWGKENPAIARLEKAVAEPRNRVVRHPLYADLDNLEAVVTFMEHHVFAVWDFMSLLKSLQRNLTCVEVPWVPKGSSESRRLVNDIVLVEESDEFDGGFISHFELYLKGMADAGADTGPIDSLILRVSRGESVSAALSSVAAPAPAERFVAQTWNVIENSPAHCQAAAFAFGREDLIPDMFDQVVNLNKSVGNKLDAFVDYLERHIEVDSEEHTPMAMQMVADLCGDDQEKWRQSEHAVNVALNARLQLWDGVHDAIVGGGHA
jgi:Protein of unknown function (DUF3050)